MPQRPKNRRPERRAGILLTVLVLIVLMTVGAASYFEWTFVEYRASRVFVQQTQARYAAESGVESLLALLAEDPADIEAAGGLYDNPARFRGLLLADSDADELRCRASLIAPLLDYGEYAGHRFGVENESSRLNLNTLLTLDQISDTAARDRLLGLPGMTEPIADAILDWIDEDEEPREFGAELTYYSSLDPPYEPRNGPLESVEQLLLVRDVTPALLFGLDQNRDLVIDADEGAAALPEGVENLEGEMDRGWSAYLTIYSAERELNPDGEPKINVNMEDLRELHAQIERTLGRAEANFIVAFRQGGPAEGSPTGGAGGPTISAASVQIDFTAPGAETIDNLLRLVGTRVDVVQDGENERQSIEELFPGDPLRTSSYLPDLLDHLTVYSDEVVPGRLNINRAPRALIESLPGMPPEVVESVIGNRDSGGDDTRPERRHATWMLSEGYVNLEQMREMMPHVTAGGDVYRARVTGFFDQGGPRRRVVAVVDATTDTPTVLFQQDLSPLGGGLPASELGVATRVDGL